MRQIGGVWLQISGVRGSELAGDINADWKRITIIYLIVRNYAIVPA